MKRLRKWFIPMAMVMIMIFTAISAGAGMVTSLYEKITVTTGSAVALTNVPSGCSQVIIIVESNDIRYRRDGTSPATDTGMPMTSGQNIVITGWTDINNFRAIAQSATAYLSVEYRIGY